LVPKKGAHLLLQAAAQLPEPAHVTIVGDGVAKTELQRMATELGVDATFTGALSREAVASRMSTAAVLCLPTMVEAVGTVTLEAQASGVPVVAHRVGGVPEAVVDRRTGLLVEPGDVASLASALHRVLSDGPFRDRLAAAGRRHVEQNFDMRRQAAVLEGFYAEVTG
jgi:glycosyltransferase involved in cell wall biosynthesis